jgi:hypothetical protein
MMQAQKPILADLARIGISVPSLALWHFRDHLPLSANAVGILLRSLGTVTDESVQECIVDLLAKTKEPYDGAHLASLFERTDIAHNNGLLERISVTIEEARPLGLSDWVAQTATNPRFGIKRYMLMLPIARLLPAPAARQILKQLFESFPMHVAAALTEIGNEADLRFLHEHSQVLSGTVKKNVDRLIVRLKKRIEREKDKSQMCGLSQEPSLSPKELEMRGLVESSGSFDVEDVGLLLSRIRGLMQGGLDDTAIRKVVDTVERLRPNHEREFGFLVTQGGMLSELRIRIEMEDEDSVGISIFANPAFVKIIQLELERFGDEKDNR